MMSVLGNLSLPTSARSSQLLIALLSAEDLFNRGGEKVTAGDFPGAIADAREAIHLNPNDTKAYSHRGNTRFIAKDLASAIADVREAIHLNANDTNAYGHRGAAHYNL